MGWLYAAFRHGDLVLAVASAVACVISLAAGERTQALAFLGAGIWWMLLSRYWSGKARAAKRHRELRKRRLDREREGLAPARG